VSTLLLGAPTQATIERIVPGRVGPEHHARLTMLIESALHTPGRIESVGEMYRWATAQSDARMVRISVLEAGDGTTRIHAWERMSGRARGVYGSLVGGVGGGIGAGFLVPIAALFGPVVAVAWVVSVVSITTLTSRLVFGGSVRSRTTDLQRAVNALGEFIPRC